MKLRNRILISLAALLAFGVVSVAIALSYEAPCGAAPPLAEGADLMKAIVHRCYGPADTLHLLYLFGPDPDAHVVVDDALHGDKDLHRFSPLSAASIANPASTGKFANGKTALPPCRQRENHANWHPCGPMG